MPRNASCSKASCSGTDTHMPYTPKHNLTPNHPGKTPSPGLPHTLTSTEPERQPRHPTNLKPFKCRPPTPTPSATPTHSHLHAIRNDHVVYLNHRNASAVVGRVSDKLPGHPDSVSTAIRIPLNPMHVPTVTENMFRQQHSQTPVPIQHTQLIPSMHRNTCSARPVRLRGSLSP
eukprot:3719750-Rhodomonas_salina.1